MMKHLAVFIAYNCVKFYQLYLKCLGMYIFSSIYLLNFWLLNFCIVLHSIRYFQYFRQFFDLISEFQTLSGIFKFFVVSVSSSYLTAFLICFLFVRWTVCCSLNHWCPLLHIVSMTFANLFWLSCKHFLGFLDREATYNVFVDPKQLWREHHVQCKCTRGTLNCLPARRTQKLLPGFL